MRIQMKLAVLLLCMIQYVSSVVVDSANSGKRYHARVLSVFGSMIEKRKCSNTIATSYWGYGTWGEFLQFCGTRCDNNPACKGFVMNAVSHTSGKTCELCGTTSLENHYYGYAWMIQTPAQDAFFEDAPIASQTELYTAWSGMSCVGQGQTYQKGSGTCADGLICFEHGDVLECPSGAVRLNETHCSSEKEVVHDALKSHCPL